MIRMIIAVDRGNAIGWQDGRLPWRIPADLKRFKELTTGSTVLMGRTTFDSLKRPNGLPNRHNVVVTRNRELRNRPQSEPHYFTGEDALKTYCQVHQACLGCEPPDLWIIGGASVYQEAIEKKLVDEIFLTAVDAISGGDVVLPFDLYNWSHFTLSQEDKGVKWYSSISEVQQTDDFSYHFVTLKRHATTYSG